MSGTAALAAFLRVRRRGHISERQPAHVREEMTRHLFKAKLVNGQAKALAEVVALKGKQRPRPFAARSAENDPMRLRGLPVITKDGLGGAQPGTRPEDVAR